MIITITGDLGSGKSTVARALANILNYDYLSTGAIFREIATSQGMNVNELTEIARTDTNIDYFIDDKLKNLKKDNVVIDSRMAWKFVAPSFKIYLTVCDIIAAKRIYDANRESEQYASLDEALNYISKRKFEEDKRYKELYDVDINDYSNYDLILDTSSISRKEIMDIVLEKIKIFQYEKDE